MSHFNVVRLFESARTHLSFDKEDTWTLFHSYSFGFSVWEMWGAGYRVEPEEVQAVLAQDPEIAEALVVAREDGAGINQLVAYLVPRHFNAAEVNLVVNRA